MRAADLSAALTALDADPATAAHAAPRQAAAVGFFLGGTAVLALAGARLDAERYARSCDPPAQGPDCAWFAAAGVDLHAVDPAALTRSAFDPRIGTVVAIDPELTASLSSDSLSGIAAKVTILNLGDPGAIAPYLDASAVPAAFRARATPPFLAQPPSAPWRPASPARAEILAAEGEDDAICREGARCATEATRG